MDVTETKRELTIKLVLTSNEKSDLIAVLDNYINPHSEKTKERIGVAVYLKDSLELMQ